MNHFQSIFIWLLCSVCFLPFGKSQDNPLQDSLTVKVQDSIPILRGSELDTIPIRQLEGRDSINFDDFADTINLADLLNQSRTSYQISNDSLADIIDYGSLDSQKTDIVNKTVYLWGQAYVKYQNIEVKGEYITFDFEKNIATATATYDDEGKLISKANFQEGATSFQYDYLKYNFKTKKGIVKQAVTKEGELFVHGETTKFIGKDDSLYQEDYIYNKNAIVTSCNLDHPHFGIHTNKLKVVPEKLAIVGPSRLEIADIPTPLWLPFGFFPIMKGKSSGLILPNNYDLDERWGFGIQGFGYYFPINDHLDLKITGDAYLRGSFALNANSKYSKRYKYQGGLTFIGSSRNEEDREGIGYTRYPSYSLVWTHRQDTKAHPYQNFQASVNIRTAGFTQQNLVDAQSRQTDQISSSVNYSYQFGKSPFSATAGAQMTQSLSNKTVNITLPEGTLKMRSIYPFKRKEKVGKELFYEKINLTYSSKFKNIINATDSTFYTREALESASYGVNHNARMAGNFKFLKYFSFNPSLTYDEIWYFKETKRTLSDEVIVDTLNTYVDLQGNTIYEVDTTSYGIVNETLETGFLPFRQLRSSAGVSTKLFGTKQFKNGVLQGVRHVVTPSLSLSYTPNTEFLYTDTLDTDFRNDFYEEETYLILPKGLYSASPTGKNFDVNLNVVNSLEAKIQTKRDSIARKIKLSNFSYSISYNAVADSFKLSPLRFSGNTTFFKGKSTITYNFTVDPYKYAGGDAIDQYVWQDGGQLPLFTTVNLTGTLRFTFKEMRELVLGKSKSENDSKSKSLQNISLLDLFDNFRINYKVDWRLQNNGIEVTKGIRTHSLTLQGDIKITDKWQLNLSSIGYDFILKGTTFPDIGFSRDLHCWKMNFKWSPRASNLGGSYRFFVGVASNSLEFLKYNYTQNNSF